MTVAHNLKKQQSITDLTRTLLNFALPLLPQWFLECMELEPMAHEYSVKIQSFISEKISTAETMKTTAEKQNDFEAQKYYEGQLNELYRLRRYLTEKIDLKTQRYY